MAVHPPAGNRHVRRFRPLNPSAFAAGVLPTPEQPALPDRARHLDLPDRRPGGWRTCPMGTGRHGRTRRDAGDGCASRSTPGSGGSSQAALELVGGSGDGPERARIGRRSGPRPRGCRHPSGARTKRKGAALPDCQLPKPGSRRPFGAGRERRSTAQIRFGHCEILGLDRVFRAKPMQFEWCYVLACVLQHTHHPARVSDVVPLRDGTDTAARMAVPSGIRVSASGLLRRFRCTARPHAASSRVSQSLP